MNTDKLLVDIVDRYKRVLGDNLVGLYLHGSLAMGCFTPRADIDLIAVVRKPMDNDTKRALIDETFKIVALGSQVHGFGMASHDREIWIRRCLAHLPSGELLQYGAQSVHRSGFLALHRSYVGTAPRRLHHEAVM